MRKSKTGEAAPSDKALRDAFRTVEAQPAPDTLKDHLDRLAGAPPKRSGPN